MNPEAVIELQFGGEHVRPETTPIKVLANLLANLDSTLRELAPRRPGQEDLILSLIGISHGSNLVSLTADHPDMARESVSILNDIIKSQEFYRLPPAGAEVVRTLAKFAGDHGKPPELRTNKVVVSFDRSLIERMKTPIAVGETTLYGTVRKVGGEEAGIVLVLDTGGKISCRTTREVAKKAAAHLYERVCLRGEARWDTYDWSCRAFTAHEVQPYLQTPFSKALEQLAKAAGLTAWANENEVMEIIGLLRRGEDE